MHTVKGPSVVIVNKIILGKLLTKSNEWTGTNCCIIRPYTVAIGQWSRLEAWISGSLQWMEFGELATVCNG